MAAPTPICEEELYCPQCSGIYCLPVLLKCGHNVCRVCLHKYWEWGGVRDCPVCHVVCVPGRPPINLALKLAADAHQLRQDNRGSPDVCAEHDERLTHFCLNDEEPVCPSCQTSKQHKVHECCPVEEAAKQKKAEIASLLESYRKKLKAMNKTEEQWRETKTYIQTQARQTEKVMKAEFQKLHKFLWEEEKTRLKALKQEEEVKTQVMCEKLENIKDRIKSLTSTISDIEEAIKGRDLTFLQNYKKTKKRVKCNIREPECIRDILLNSAKHLGSLKFDIWKDMAKIVQYVPITLDPNTAHSNLELTEELTRVQYSRRQPLPNNPERCTSRLCALGAAGFTSGKHTWTVQVGQSKEWYIGVARESIKRKSTVFLEPAEGFWVIGLTDGDTYWAQTSPRTKLALKQRPERITVVLDCDKGKVVFLNADNQAPIHTFRDKFTERTFPFVSPELCEEGKSSSPLTICPLTISLDVE